MLSTAPVLGGSFHSAWHTSDAKLGCRKTESILISDLGSTEICERMKKKENNLNIIQINGDINRWNKDAVILTPHGS